jgi:outer membrane protein TolC
MPTINAVGNGVYSNPNQRVFPMEAKFKGTWDVGVSLSWNIMQLYTARAIVGDAKNQKAQLQKATESIKEGISMEVNANNEALKVAQLKIDLAEKAIEQAKENKRILDNRFEAQVALLSDVLEADQLLLQAQTNLLNAQADAAIASYKLERSINGIK